LNALGVAESERTTTLAFAINASASEVWYAPTRLSNTIRQWKWAGGAKPSSLNIASWRVSTTKTRTVLDLRVCGDWVVHASTDVPVPGEDIWQLQLLVSNSDKGVFTSLSVPAWKDSEPMTSSSILSLHLVCDADLVIVSMSNSSRHLVYQRNMSNEWQAHYFEYPSSVQNCQAYISPSFVGCIEVGNQQATIHYRARTSIHSEARDAFWPSSTRMGNATTSAQYSSTFSSNNSSCTTLPAAVLPPILSADQTLQPALVAAFVVGLAMMVVLGTVLWRCHARKQRRNYHSFTADVLFNKVSFAIL
jgi:hypothetical protein